MRNHHLIVFVTLTTLLFPCLTSGTKQYLDHFNTIYGFRNASKAVERQYPSVRGAIVTKVKVENNSRIYTYTIGYRKGVKSYEVAVRSSPGGQSTVVWFREGGEKGEVDQPKAEVAVDHQQIPEVPKVVQPPQPQPQPSADPILISPAPPPPAQYPQNPSTTPSTLNGDFRLGNYIWGAAMNLAWNELLDNLNNGRPLDLFIHSNIGKEYAKNFNARPFTTKDMSEESYYVRSGYGQETVRVINREVKRKFPEKSFSDLQVHLGEKDIISYAYFIKQVQYLTQFQKNPEPFSFQEKNGDIKHVQSFRAKTPQQRNNIQIFNYTNDDNFIIRLKLKQANEQLFVIKGSQDRKPQDIVSMVSGASQQGRMARLDKFQMPVIQFDIERKYTEMVGATVQSGALKDYSILQMVEKIKFRVDEVGAKVENQAFMLMGTTSLIWVEPRVKNLVLDRPFWIVMKEKGEHHPYFITQINNAEFMKSA